MALPKDYIPVSKKIQEFKSYLDSTDRAILSARFGDGKSTFLEEFAAKCTDYLFFTIYPLNYQVAGNKDIFEYIKRDILLQMLSYVELEEETYDSLLMISNYLWGNKLSILDDIIDSTPDIDLKIISTSIVKKPLRNLIKNIHKFKKYKDDISSKSDVKILERVICEFESSRGSIYEFDLVTQLICKINNTIKRSENKEIVLIIEDLDRMDPAHIFRILNVLSAHTDRHHNGESELRTTLGGNKYMFDKLLIVCDFDNIKSIFHHFYGSDTDFKGYISKFSPHKHFKYSLIDEYKNFILRKTDPDLMNFPNVMSKLATLILSKTSEESSLRNIASRMQINTSLIKTENIPLERNNLHISSLNNLTKLLYISKQFDISTNDLHKELMKPDTKTEFCKLIGMCWLSTKNNEKEINLCYEDGLITLYRPRNHTEYTFATTITSDSNLLCNINIDQSMLERNIDGKTMIDQLLLILSYFETFLINK